MVSTADPIWTLVSAVHPLKSLSLISFIPLPMLAVVKAVQFWKALLPNDVTLFGMLIAVSFLHP